MTVSVVLLVRDEMATLSRVFASVRTQENVEPFEIVAIDSGSVDGSAEFLERQPGVTLARIPAHEFHHSRTRNLGASLARGELLVFLAADAVPLSSSWLKALIAPFDDPLVQASYGRQVARPEHGLQAFRLGYMYPAEPARRSLADVGRDRRAYALSNVNSCVRKAFWRGHPFPDDVPIAEDLAMARAILHGGGTIAYAPDAVVEHSHEFGPAGWFRRYYALGRVLRDLELRGSNGAGGGGDGTPRLRRDGIRYAFKELGWSLRTHGPGYACRSAAASIAKAFGYAIGRRYRMLPAALQKTLEYRPRPDTVMVPQAARNQ